MAGNRAGTLISHIVNEQGSKQTTIYLLFGNDSKPWPLRVKATFLLPVA
jgi:hypothetical protein